MPFRHSNVELVAPATSEVLSLAEFKLHARIDIPDEDPDLALKIRAARAHVEEITGRALLTSTWDAYFEAFPPEYCIDLPKGRLQSVAWVKYTDASDVQNTLSPLTYRVLMQREIGQIALKFALIWPADVLQNGDPVVVRFTAGWPNYSGVVNVSGTTVTRQSGDNFDTSWLPDTPIVIDNTAYLIASVTSTSVIELQTSAGTVTGKRWALNTVPANIKAAIHMLAAHWYVNREAVVVGNTAAAVSKPLEMAVDSLVAPYRLWRF